jgi:anti-sigma factor (TIGR02949 family)
MTRVNCQEAIDLLYDYLKQELTPEHAAEMKRHLERCRPCLSHAQFEQSFLAMLESCGRQQTCPRELRARILTALRAEAKGH